MTDVLIAGAGIAGSALAIMLGRAGVSVELFEQRRLPQEKPCGEGLMPAGVAVLQRLGLAEAVGGAPFVGIRYRAGHLLAEGRFPAPTGERNGAPALPAMGVGQRRLHLDQALFDAARDTPGVRAWTGTRVDGPLLEHGRVVGLIAEGQGRRGRLLVAADGPFSMVRKQLDLDGPAPRRRRIGLRTHFRLAPGQEQPPWVEVFMGDHHELYVTPLPNREILVAGLAERDRIDNHVKADFWRWIKAQPVLQGRLEGAERLTAFMGRGPLASRARAGFTRGAVLLGDAAGFLDPVTGGGMAQALLSAELLARYMPDILVGVGGALERFDAERRALLRDYRILTALVLELAAHPRLVPQALQILRDHPRLFSHLIGVAGGVTRLLG